MYRDEIVIGGLGGQGIVLAGYIMGKAAALFDRKNATHTQDYGPEARGGSCRTQVVISDDKISYPYIDNPSVLAVMSQGAYNTYSSTIRPDTLLLIDENLVKPKNTRLFSIPATRLAQELGRTAANERITTCTTVWVSKKETTGFCSSRFAKPSVRVV